jgi:hypothetical protein
LKLKRFLVSGVDKHPPEEAVLMGKQWEVTIISFATPSPHFVAHDSDFGSAEFIPLQRAIVPGVKSCVPLGSSGPEAD